MEIPKTDKTETQEDVLQAALQELPEKLKPALAAQGVKVNEIHVTIGSSCAATCQALASGNVNLAFLPADSFAAVKGGKAILAAGAVCPAVTGTNPSRWTGSYGKAEKRGVGNRALLCTSETEYGRNLAGRVSSGKKLTWNELDHARWGVLGTDSLAGYQCPELWLEDHYDGSSIGNLSNVTAYDSEKELVAAASSGKIDLFPIQADTRGKYTSVWPKIQKQAVVIAVTKPLYTWVAAVSPEVQKRDGFARALLNAVRDIRTDDRQMRLIFGTDPYKIVKDTALDGMRQLQSEEE